MSRPQNGAARHSDQHKGAGGESWCPGCLERSRPTSRPAKHSATAFRTAATSSYPLIVPADNSCVARLGLGKWSLNQPFFLRDNQSYLHNEVYPRRGTLSDNPGIGRIQELSAESLASKQAKVWWRRKSISHRIWPVTCKLQSQVLSRLTKRRHN
ncbi:hypothetical protein BD289DRAFT_110408 [Coniella lustricola]|uniref:Uncharacterized protein n=1 Tax=Coniella lustricola TaxID=2025994 RepID=A0A2T2ZXA0_9PEZI|nr:hypothetical protein BD289DRAFT_110408 [Coniella lustricola]